MQFIMNSLVTLKLGFNHFFLAPFSALKLVPQIRPKTDVIAMFDSPSKIVMTVVTKLPHKRNERARPTSRQTYIKDQRR